MKVAGISEPAAQAVLGSFRVAKCMQTILRIAEAEKWDAERKTELIRIFSQLGTIYD
jgi:hypothetical protein